MAIPKATFGRNARFNGITAATEALATVMGHGETVVAPHARRAKAVATCVQTFGAVAEGLAWLIDQGGNGAERGIAMELHASLNELTDRYAVPKRESVAMEAPPPRVH